jgi:hypothetical protein
MRVLVVAEGKHELSGALENLLKRLGGESSTFDYDRVSNDTIHAFHGIGNGYFRRALRWLIEAEKRGVDALILLIDEDGRRERIEQIQEAQDSSLSRFPRAMGVAIRTFDAWMLADEKALTEVLDYNINRQTDPETIRNPKQVCEELLTNSQIQIPQREMYARVSSKINIDILCSRCQSGFRPFATYVRNIFQCES